MEQDTQNELSVLRAKLQAMSDIVHGHGLRLELQQMELQNVKKAIDVLAATAATGEQLSNTSVMVQLKLDRLSDEFAEIRGQMVWGVRLVVGAVILAVIALVTRGGTL